MTTNDEHYQIRVRQLGRGLSDPQPSLCENFEMCEEEWQFQISN
jgi:hypothetical protein